MKDINTRINVYGVDDIYWYDFASEIDARFEYAERWEVDRTTSFKVGVEGISGFSYYVNDKYTETALIKSEALAAKIHFTKKSCALDITIVSDNQTLLEGFKESLTILFPPVPEPSTDKVSVKFWYNTPQQGPQYSKKVISVPDWESIQENYDKDARASLQKLIKEFSPQKGGQLLLFSGKAGTGKTYALRALCREWKDWCSIEYILDPESLFGHSPAYLANMIFDSSQPYLVEDGDDEEDEDHKWKLLILEDTGELIREDAKEHTQQAFSRLLNVADGFIGQGLRVLILITTNEEVEKLHPAITRPGRCAAEIDFKALSGVELASWCKTHKIPVPTTPTTLAQLYDKLTQVKKINGVSKQESQLGFRIA